MMHKAWQTSLLVLVLLGLAAGDAAAWGTRAQRAITATAIQVLRREAIANAFKTATSNYEEDVLRGSVAGSKVLTAGKLLPSDADNVTALANEISLLREVRQYGFGSYFSYRMGVAASLAADLLLPFALDPSPAGQRLLEQIEADIEAQLQQYSFTPTRSKCRYIVDVANFVDQCRPFFAENARLIAHDYASGKGYDGFLRESAPVFFGRAVEAVADVWYTVLRVAAEPGETTPPADHVAWYLVDEIQYLLVQKRNLYEAGKVYDHFAHVNPGVTAAYEKLGDLYYDFGTDEAKARAVREWQIAYDALGPNRRRISQKLANHYIAVGEALLEEAAQPGASDEGLPNALNAFNEALEYDQANDFAQSRIKETRIAIAERKERRDMNVNVIASADKVIIEAEKKKVDGDFGGAIATYKQGIELFQLIDDEFPDQHKTAKDSIKSVDKNITDVINDVLDKASDAIDEGDRAVDERRFGEGVAAYQRVPQILAVVPDDESTTHTKEKQDLIETADGKVGDAKKAQAAWAEREKARKAAAAAAAATRPK